MDKRLYLVDKLDIKQVFSLHIRILRFFNTTTRRKKLLLFTNPSMRCRVKVPYQNINSNTYLFLFTETNCKNVSGYLEYYETVTE